MANRQASLLPNETNWPARDLPVPNYVLLARPEPNFSRLFPHFVVDALDNLSDPTLGSIQEPRQNLSQGSRTLPQKENLANLGNSPRTTNCQAPSL